MTLRLRLIPTPCRSTYRWLSIDCVPRNNAHPENLLKAADYISEIFKTHGAIVEERPFERGGHIYKNVLGRFGPEDTEAIIVGAHYDAASIYPGADDNASGVAGLLELSRMLAGEKLSNQIILAAFTLEEPPYFATESMGSAIYAKELRESGKSIKLMICLEMIGYYSDVKKSQDYPSLLLKLFYPSRGNFIAIVDQVFSKHGPRMKRYLKRTLDLPVYSISAPAAIPGVDFSDHRNFWAHNFPAVMVTDTAFYRNKAYHTAEDTADRLDYQKMAEVGLWSVCVHTICLLIPI